jgi:hypothetical protein
LEADGEQARELHAEGRAECWRIIDSRDWFVEMITNDYEGELIKIDRELQAKLEA